MKRFISFLLVFIICVIPCVVFAEEVIPETSTINNTEDVEISVLEETTEEVVEENTDNTETADSDLELLLAKIDFLISLIYCWFLWTFFCSIYKVLYRLFCFVI